MARGTERREIFDCGEDRRDFAERLGVALQRRFAMTPVHSLRRARGCSTRLSRASREVVHEKLREAGILNAYLISRQPRADPGPSQPSATPNNLASFLPDSFRIASNRYWWRSDATGTERPPRNR